MGRPVTTSPEHPHVSVVVPVCNGAATIDRCIASIQESTYRSFELIVVDDGSADASAEMARTRDARVMRASERSGPAAARNAAAREARGDIVLFVDSDIVVQPTTIEQFVRYFDADPSLAGVFGSYDDEPHAANFVSQYRNLLHHFVHQTSERQSASFWAGCGAIRLAAFNAVGGFDEVRYPRPAIEDIELGHRLRLAGFTIRLQPEVQVKHLKRWTSFSMVKTDIMDRAYPWSKLLVAEGNVPNDLNLRWQHRLSAVLVALLVVTVIFLALGHRRFYWIPAEPAAAAFALLLLAQLFPLNRQFYGFLVRTRGWWFAARAVPMHFLYYLYSGATFGIVWAWHRVRPAPRGDWPPDDKLRPVPMRKP